MTNGRRSRAGFTLLELILAIGIVGVVSTLGFQILYRITDGYGELRHRTEIDANARQALALIRRDVADMAHPRTVGEPISSTAADITDLEDERFWRIPLENDVLRFPVLLRGADEEERVAVVHYWIERGNGAGALRRWVGGLGEEPGEDDGAAQLRGVIGFRTEFATGGDPPWLPYWDDPAAAPKAIRVSFSLMDPDRPDFQAAHRAVIPVFLDDHGTEE